MSQAEEKKEKPVQKVPKILIVDDNQPTLNLMKKYFAKAQQRKDLNCEIIEAHDGDEAIQMINVAQPNIIMCDIDMPKKNGFEVLQLDTLLTGMDNIKKQIQWLDPYQNNNTDKYLNNALVNNCINEEYILKNNLGLRLRIIAKLKD